LREFDKVEIFREREIFDHSRKDRFLMWCERYKPDIVRGLRSWIIIYQVVPWLDIQRKGFPINYRGGQIAES